MIQQFLAMIDKKIKLYEDDSGRERKHPKDY
jgi:hypothetical protein